MFDFFFGVESEGPTRGSLGTSEEVPTFGVAEKRVE